MVIEPVAVAPTPSPTPTPTPSPQTGTVSVTTDILYGQGATTAGSIDLFVDVYQPSETCDANRPVVLFLHGGGYVSGDKQSDDVTELADAMNARGLAFVSIQYRLQADDAVVSAEADAFLRESLEDSDLVVPDVLNTTIIASVEDTLLALNFLEDNQDTYCLDTSRIAYTGSSAGTITVLQVAYSLEDFTTDFPQPTVVADLWGDLPIDEDLDPGEAPFIVVHGTDDPLVPYQAALDLTAQADVVGVPFALYSVQGAGHSFSGTNFFETEFEGETLSNITADFVEDHLTGEAPVYGRFDVQP
ncbi:MAG: alpha/beta hydrolase [Pseudomonadota bacterium]